jgi:hypothetical protein
MRYAIVVILLLVANVVLAQTTEEQKVLALSNKKFKWLIEKQADSLVKLLDERVLYIHSNGYAQSKSNVIEDLKSGKLIYKKVDVIEALARVYPNLAIVTGKGMFLGAIDERPFELELLYTEVYVLNKKKWLLVSRHANRLP